MWFDDVLVATVFYLKHKADPFCPSYLQNVIAIFCKLNQVGSSPKSLPSTAFDKVTSDLKKCPCVEENLACGLEYDFRECSHFLVPRIASNCCSFTDADCLEVTKAINDCMYLGSAVDLTFTGRSNGLESPWVTSCFDPSYASKFNLSEVKPNNGCELLELPAKAAALTHPFLDFNKWKRQTKVALKQQYHSTYHHKSDLKKLYKQIKHIYLSKHNLKSLTERLQVQTIPFLQDLKNYADANINQRVGDFVPASLEILVVAMAVPAYEPSLDVYSTDNYMKYHVQSDKALKEINDANTAQRAMQFNTTYERYVAHIKELKSLVENDEIYCQPPKDPSEDSECAVVTLADINSMLGQINSLLIILKATAENVRTDSIDVIFKVAARYMQSKNDRLLKITNALNRIDKFNPPPNSRPEPKGAIMPSQEMNVGWNVVVGLTSGWSPAKTPFVPDPRCPKEVGSDSETPSFFTQYYGEQNMQSGSSFGETNSRIHSYSFSPSEARDSAAAEFQNNTRRPSTQQMKSLTRKIIFGLKQRLEFNEFYTDFMKELDNLKFDKFIEDFGASLSFYKRFLGRSFRFDCDDFLNREKSKFNTKSNFDDFCQSNAQTSNPSAAPESVPQSDSVSADSVSAVSADSVSADSVSADSVSADSDLQSGSFGAEFGQASFSSPTKKGGHDQILTEVLAVLKATKTSGSDAAAEVFKISSDPAVFSEALALMDSQYFKEDTYLFADTCSQYQIKMNKKPTNAFSLTILAKVLNAKTTLDIITIAALIAAINMSTESLNKDAMKSRWQEDFAHLAMNYDYRFNGAQFGAIIGTLAKYSIISTNPVHALQTYIDYNLKVKTDSVLVEVLYMFLMFGKLTNITFQPRDWGNIARTLEEHRILTADNSFADAPEDSGSLDYYRSLSIIMRVLGMTPNFSPQVFVNFYKAYHPDPLVNSDVRKIVYLIVNLKTELPALIDRTRCSRILEAIEQTYVVQFDPADIATLLYHFKE